MKRGRDACCVKGGSREAITHSFRVSLQCMLPKLITNGSLEIPSHGSLKPVPLFFSCLIYDACNMQAITIISYFSILSNFAPSQLPYHQQCTGSETTAVQVSYTQKTQHQLSKSSRQQASKMYYGIVPNLMYSFDKITYF